MEKENGSNVGEKEKKGWKNPNLNDEINYDEFTFRQELTATVKGTVTYIPIKKPSPQSWIYIPSNPGLRSNVAILELEERRECYLVHPEVAASLDGEVSNRILVPYFDRENAIFIWAIKLTDRWGKENSWTISARAIVHEYVDQWIKIQAVPTGGCYEVKKIPSSVPPPEIPEGGRKFLMDLAFKDRIITSLDHPVIQKLKGLM